MTADRRWYDAGRPAWAGKQAIFESCGWLACNQHHVFDVDWKYSYCTEYRLKMKKSIKKHGSLADGGFENLHGRFCVDLPQNSKNPKLCMKVGKNTTYSGMNETQMPYMCR